MPPLDRAFPLAEVHHRAVMIAEHLELDVARTLDVLFDVHVADAEGGLGFTLRRLERPAELGRGVNDPHAAATAARHRLDDDRIPEILGDLQRLLFAVDRTVAAREDRDAGFLHGAARAGLVPKEPDHVGRRPDELDVAGLADLRQIRALGEEPVPGMDRVGAGDLCRADDGRHAQIAVRAAGRADADVLVREAHVQRVLVRLGPDRHRLDTQFPAGADDAQGDLAAVGDQNFLEHES